MFDEGSNTMSQEMDNVFNKARSTGMDEIEAALFTLTKLIEFLADPEHLEKAIRNDMEIAAVGTVNIMRWTNEWLYVKRQTWTLPDTMEGLLL